MRGTTQSARPSRQAIWSRSQGHWPGRRFYSRSVSVWKGGSGATADEEQQDQASNDEGHPTGVATRAAEVSRRSLGPRRVQWPPLMGYHPTAVALTATPRRPVRGSLGKVDPPPAGAVAGKVGHGVPLLVCGLARSGRTLVKEANPVPTSAGLRLRDLSRDFRAENAVKGRKPRQGPQKV